VRGNDNCYRIGCAAVCQKCVGCLSCLSILVSGQAELISHADGGHAPFSLHFRKHCALANHIKAPAGKPLLGALTIRLSAPYKKGLLLP